MVIAGMFVEVQHVLDIKLCMRSSAGSVSNSLPVAEKKLASQRCSSVQSCARSIVEFNIDIPFLLDSLEIGTHPPIH